MIKKHKKVNNWLELDLEVLEKKDVIKKFTPVITKRVKWKSVHSLKEFIVATIRELSG